MADTYKIIHCPACGKTMKKIFVPSAGVSVDICADGCGGIFLDNQEINQFKDGRIDSTAEIKKLLENKNFASVDTGLIRVCPACGSNMVKGKFGGIYTLEVDTCYSCGGIFLDYGELDLIRSSLNQPKKKIPQNSPKPFSVEEYYTAAKGYSFQDTEPNFDALNTILTALDIAIPRRWRWF